MAADEPPTWTKRTPYPDAMLPAVHFDTTLVPLVRVVIDRTATTPAPYDALIVETPDDIEILGLIVDGVDHPLPLPVMPGSAFAPGSRRVPLPLMTRRGPGIPAGTPLTLIVRSTANTPRPFKARLTVLGGVVR